MATTCLRCRTHHANPTTFDSWDVENWNASEDDVIASHLDPDGYLAMWERAATAMDAAHRVVDSLKDYRRTLPKGSAERRAIGAVINEAGLAACRAQEACWRLPHPSQIKRQRIGCL